MNVVRLVGIVGAAPECAILPNGRGSVLKLRVVTDDADGQEWHRVTLRGPQAPIIKAALSIGDTVIVHGHLRTTCVCSRRTKQYLTEVVAARVLRAFATSHRREA